ncbi:MAG: hypothetical protein AAGA48_29275 [Myxococcota bacterium]
MTGWLFVSMAHASTFVDVPTIEALNRRSAAVVEGIVMGTQSEPCALGLCTTYQVSVTETWRGDARGAIEFVLPGGRSGGLTQRVSGLPLWSRGDEVVIFLDDRGQPSWTSLFTVVSVAPSRREDLGLGSRELVDPLRRRDLTSVQVLRDQVREAQSVRR